MLADRYDLAISTDSAAARDAYVQGTERLLTMYPGAIEAFDRAISADPGFAMAHAGKAQMLAREGNMAAARACLAAARALEADATAREASHIAFFGLVFSGQADAAIAALRTHLAEWPRDALVLTATATPNGLIGNSGTNSPKRQVAELMDGLAPHYGDDAWFLAHHGMALSEDERRDAARLKIERSLALNPRNAWVAHARAHVAYEDGEAPSSRAFLASWLPDYPRAGSLHGHLSWHLALAEIAAGDIAAAERLFHDAITLVQHSGPPAQKMTDAAAFLWRAELAGRPHDPAAWQVLHDFAARMLPNAGTPLADLHVALAQAVAGDGDGLESRIRQMHDLAAAGRYPSGDFVPALSRGFVALQSGDFSAAIQALEPLVHEGERIGGSRAQLDLVAFTLLRAYVAADRMDDVRHLLAERRRGAAVVPVTGVLH